MRRIRIGTVARASVARHGLNPSRRMASVPILRRGFTLVELLVVIAIIAILAGLFMAALSAIYKQRKIVLAQKQVSDIAQAASAYSQELHVYPPDTGDVVLSKGAVTSAAFTDDEVETDEPYRGSGPDGYVLDSLYWFLGSKVVDQLTNKTYGPFLIINLRHVRTVDGYSLFLDPWGNPYLMDALHVLQKRVAVPDGRDQTLVDTDLEVKRVGWPYADTVPANERLKEVKAWSLGPDGKGGSVPFSQVDGDPTEQADKDNLKSW